ncbi:MAG: septal ring lytic transglycosylase RlpA family protein [Calothrix sp. CSU_2_0]|nr:septal ring lytic transglycosylase RlpA family protein [Calothrix sp. CSU_2_0]
MNQKKLWSVVVLSTTVVGIPSVASAGTTGETLPAQKTSNVDKVNSKTSQSSVITKIHPHQLAGRQATTLYIRNIPFLTFIAEESAGGENINPTEKASIIASKINQLIAQKVDANQITVSWKKDRHAIKINAEELLEINSYTQLPDTTNNLAQDALQATNRLRRLIGGAKPLNQIDGVASILKKNPEVSFAIGEAQGSKTIPERTASRIAEPKKIQQPTKPQKPTTKTQQARKKQQPIAQQVEHKVKQSRTRSTFSGMASYYGYESGSRTASGERFNPNLLTAAHRTLPLGTRVRVTNLYNGSSVIVRINDRGPFIRGRIIDVSYGAAKKLRMIGSGVASVKIEVLS